MNKIFYLFYIFALNSFAFEKSICGPTDDRQISSDPRIGRVNDGTRSVCTVTLIGKTCALTAGHCLSILNEVSFNVPISRNGEIANSDQKDRYKVDTDEIYYADNGQGDDYAVIKILPNTITQKYPGEAQGFYDVSFERVKNQDEVYVIGYGKDERGDRNHAQQIHQGQIISQNLSQVEHSVDTRFGNSGSVIIDSISKKIIGIHTHGACYSSGGGNLGTLINRHNRLTQAIKNCLSMD